MPFQKSSKGIQKC